MHTLRVGPKTEKPALATQARPKAQTMNVHHPPIVRNYPLVVITRATPKKFALRCIQRISEVLLHYKAPQMQVNTVSHHTSSRGLLVYLVFKLLCQCDGHATAMR